MLDGLIFVVKKKKKISTKKVPVRILLSLNFCLPISQSKHVCETLFKTHNLLEQKLQTKKEILNRALK